MPESKDEAAQVFIVDGRPMRLVCGRMEVAPDDWLEKATAGAANYEWQGTAHDSGAVGHELVGRKSA
ncbi:MAG: hypothetical protein ABJP87_15195 [Bauldia litoralis]|uniref:hypothetical protein n=1 Tax=Hyphomicrobiales TaxID=356 RepID=UPI003299A85D